MQRGRCSECGLTPEEPGRIALIDDGTPAEGFPEDPEERCSRCGRYLWCVIRIVYDDAEGGGA
jgi:ribosomal protein L37E